MTGPVWIEQLNSLHRVVARTRCSGDKLRIGRGYGNDLVLDDPRVAADHLVVHIAADGGVNVQAQGDCTLFVEGERAPCRVAAIDGDSILRIGHTRLRIRGASYPVPESLASEGARPRHLLIVGNLLLLVTLLLLALDQWRNNATGAPYWRQLPDTFILVFLVLLWAGGWALVSRLMGHRSRFAAHEFIAALALFAIALLDALLGPLLYGLSLTPPVYLQGLLAGLVGVAMVYAHIGALGEHFQPARRRFLILGMAVMAATVVANSEISQEDKGDPPNIVSGYPPAFRLVPARPLAEVLSDLNGMESAARATLDKPVPEKLR